MSLPGSFAIAIKETSLFAELLEIEILKIDRILGTRLVAMSFRSVSTMWKNFKSFVAHFTAAKDYQSRESTNRGVRSLWVTSLWRHSHTAAASEDSSSSAGENLPKDDVDKNEEQKSFENKILTAALPYVFNYGWTKHAIAAGAEAAGLPGIAHGLFPRGGAHLVEHFYASCNQKLSQHLEDEVQLTNEDISRKKPTSVFVNDAVEYRLRMIGPYVENWPQAVGIMTLPPNVPTALANLLTLVDDICYYAGDRSVDFGWYTRRVSLAGIYKMTELYMMQDKSDDFQETWQFLRRRISEAERLHAYFQQSEEAKTIARETAAAAFITKSHLAKTMVHHYDVKAEL